jgi:pimeloyl-ACP methyl ester carboxylesterase
MTADISGLARLAAPFAFLPLALAMASCRAEPAADLYPKDLVVAPIGQPPRWQSCDWDPKAQDNLAECAFVTVPLDYAAPDRGQFRLLVKRRPAKGRMRAQVWLVHGGPGASATAGMKDLSFGIPALRDDITFYAVDHRGVGGSERLGCPTQESANSTGGTLIDKGEWSDCLATLRASQGQRLEHFTTTHAARDLAGLVASFRQPEVPVFVYGGSYGTYLVRRYLSIAPAAPDGVILEGLVTADGGMTGYDARLESNALLFLDACDADEACVRHFKAPLRTEMAQMLAELNRGHCAMLNLKPGVAKQLMAAMTFYSHTRVLVPPLVHRIRRCGWRDVWFVARIALIFAKESRNGHYSPVLHNHVAISEMYRPASSVAQLQSQFDKATISTGLELSYAQLYDRWPRYPKRADDEQANPYQGPLLMLQGGLDPASTLGPAERVARSYKGAAQHLVVFPGGAHGVMGATPTVDGSDCARRIYLAFIDNPRSAPDRSCIADTRALNWRTIPAVATDLAGTTDLWGD